MKRAESKAKNAQAPSPDHIVTSTEEGWNSLAWFVRAARANPDRVEVRREGQQLVARVLPERPPKGTAIDPKVTEYAEVLAHAVGTFGSRARANAWLNRPSRIFNNQSPLQILTQDPAAVEEELVRIDHGMFP